MHGDGTPDAYLNRAQEYADALAAISEPVKDKDLVMLAVSGLREEYNNLKTIITVRQSLTAFNEFHALLSDHDYMHGKNHAPAPSITSSFAANYAVGSPSMLEARQAQLSELTAQLSAPGFQVSPIVPSGPQAFYGVRPSNHNKNNNNNNHANRNNSRGNNNNRRRGNGRQFDWASNQNTVYGTCNRCDTRENIHVTPNLEAMDNLEAYYGDDALHVGNGIIHRRSCPHTSKQNDFVERRDRHVMETGLTLLAQACVPQRFWQYAFNIAVYLINRMPSRTSTNKLPFEHIFKCPSSPCSSISSLSSVSHLSPTSQTSPESSNGQPSLVSTTLIPTPPPPIPPPPLPPITPQRLANLL
ncbi:nucleotide-binding alpha-beta plait domain-containing protein [Tanacetum coccineum]